MFLFWLPCQFSNLSLDLPLTCRNLPLTCNIMFLCLCWPFSFFPGLWAWAGHEHKHQHHNQQTQRIVLSTHTELSTHIERTVVPIRQGGWLWWNHISFFPSVEFVRRNPLQRSRGKCCQTLVFQLFNRIEPATKLSRKRIYTVPAVFVVNKLARPEPAGRTLASLVESHTGKRCCGEQWNPLFILYYVCLLPKR